MIVQKFKIHKYNWKVTVYYYVDRFYCEEIMEELSDLDCDPDNLKDAYNNLKRSTLNSGLCYSNPVLRESLIVIARTSSPEQFLNSCFHEVAHLCDHIGKEFGIDPGSEEFAYLAGSIGQSIYKKAKYFLCECHADELIKRVRK